MPSPPPPEAYAKIVEGVQSGAIPAPVLLRPSQGRGLLQAPAAEQPGGHVRQPGGDEDGDAMLDEALHAPEGEEEEEEEAGARPGEVYPRAPQRDGFATEGGSFSKMFSFSSRGSGLRREKFVQFRDLAIKKQSRSVPLQRLSVWAGGLILRWMEAAEGYWIRYGRPMVIVTSLFELWSMGIWLGFLTEPAMAKSLEVIVLVDMGCNTLYIIDTTFMIGEIYLEEQRRTRTALEHDRRRRKKKQGEQPRPGTRVPPVEGKEQEGGKGSDKEEVVRGTIRQKLFSQGTGQLATHGAASMLQGLSNTRGRYQLKMLCGLFLAFGMVPIQVLLLQLLHAKRYVAWQVVLVLAFRAGRVIWAFRDCLQLINQQEREVYVDIQMHGTSGSPWNRGRILAKQFLIVVFFGHWFGCLAYAIRKAGASLQNNVRFHPDNTRDYFEQFEDRGQIPFRAGENFWQSYLLTLYKGFNLNYEDLLPERPLDLMLEVLGSVMILLMKSYCIGSFFKYHQKREVEVTRFAKMMVSVEQYLDLYEVPPSLRKAVTMHFRFQQANHRKIKTLVVLGRLPTEVQKKLKEFEVLPIVVDRNPTVFGAGISTEYCMHIAVRLAARFLQPGEVIFLESELPRELVFLDSGAVSFSRSITSDTRTTEQLMKYVRADRKDDATVLGGVSLILGCSHFFSARVRAGTEAVTLNAPRVAFEDLNAAYPDQHEQLIRNVAEAHLLDVKGRDIPNAERTQEHENETFLALQQDVRKTLQERRDKMITTFSYAASTGDVKLVKELLQKRIEANVNDYDKRSALHLAASEGKNDVLEALLEAHGEPNLEDRWGSTPMQDALKNGFMGAAKLLQRYQGSLVLADPAGEMCTHASQGNTIQMQQLLDFGVDANAGDYDLRTALHLSASEGHLPVVTFLTSRKADVNCKDRWQSTPMEDAIRHGFATVASHLRAQGGRMKDEFAASRLCDAASTGDLRMLQMLFETGVDVDQGDYDARTALHLAAAEGQVLALNYLVHTARASHSPVDRWGATPLQDALVGGHDLCVQILMSAGAGLGPSADQVDRQRVSTLSLDMGFGKTGGIKAFSESSCKLQRRLGAHLNLVEKGRARSDIFDVEKARRFNQKVVNASFEKMRELCEEATWMVDMLRTLEAASEPTWQLLRLIRDGVSMSSEAKFWAEMHALEAKKKRRKAGRPKDARDMVFHRAFLNSTRFVPALVNVIEATTLRVLNKVEHLARGKTAGQGKKSPTATKDRHSVSTLVGEELLKELGWLTEESEGFERIRGGDRDHEFTQRHLTMRLEGLVGLLLPGEHLCACLFQGALLLQGNGVRVHDPALPAPAANDALGSLRTWLDAHSRTALSGKPAPNTRPPRMPEGTQMDAMYGSLWLPELNGVPQRQRQAPLATRGTRLAKSATVESDALMEPSHATACLVAAEMVLLAVTALVLEGWDHGAKLHEYGKELPRQANRGTQSKLAQLSSRGAAMMQLSQGDFQELGGICRLTALACRGVAASDREEQQLLRRTLKQKVREERRKAKEAAAGQKESSAGGSMGAKPGQGAQANDNSSSDEDDEEAVAALPIRVSKILALQDKMSVDELIVLVDIDDLRRVKEDGKPVRIFGELSRERFVLNLLRCMLNHDESQKDLVASVMRRDAEQERALEQEVLDTAAPPQSLSVSMSPQMRTRTLSGISLGELYEEVDKLQEQFSQGGDSGSVDAGRMDTNARFPDGQVPSEFQRSGGFWPWRQRKKAQGGGAEELHAGSAGRRMSAQQQQQLADAPEGAVLAASRSGAPRANVMRRLLRFCGEEGRTRRKQRRIAKRFRELDDDGEGIGTAETAQLLAVAFQHTLGTEQELRWAYRVFELLNKADVGDLVKLSELLQVLPRLEEEIRDQQRKQRRGGSVDTETSSMWLIIRVASRMVVPPESQFLLIWDIVRKLVVVYYLLEVPIHFCFLSEANLQGWEKIFFAAASGFSDVFMALNIVLTFFRGFVHPSLGVVSVFQDIRMHYVFGLFCVDMLACCPVDLWLPEKVQTAGLLARPRAAMRLLRLLHMRHFLTQEPGSQEASQGFYRAAWSMSMIILTLAHFLACFWWLLGTRYDSFDPLQAYNMTYTYDKYARSGRGSWTYIYVHRPGESALGDSSGRTPYWWQYLVSFYWTMGRITSQSSPGNLFAGSWGELLWICALFFLNVAVNGYCDGILVDKVIAGDEQAIEAKAMRKIIDEYLQTAQLPPELIKDIRASAEQSNKVVEHQRMESTIAALPHSVKQRVARRIFVPRLVAAEIFASCPEHFIIELGAHCRILMVGKDQPLAHPGEPANQLLILNAGRVGVIDSGGLQMAETTQAGEMIAEMPFIFDLKHVVFINALEESGLTVLARADFANTCTMYPEESMALKRNAIKVIQSISGANEDDEHRSSVSRKQDGSFGRAKSTLSFAGTTASSGSSSAGSGNTTVSHTLRRLYAQDMRVVVEKLRQEQAAAKKDLVCKFVQLAADGDVARVDAYIAKGEVAVDEGDYDQRTALHLAVCGGHLEVVKALIEKHNASIHLKDRFEHTPVDDAVREKQVAIVQYLISLGARYQVDAGVAAQLCQAAFDNDLATMQLLLKDVGVNPNCGDYDKRTALHLGASEGHLAVVELLVSLKDIDLSPKDRLGNTPLDDAMRHKHPEVRKLLHERGAKMGVRNMGVTMCELASRNDVERLRELAESDVSVGEGDYDSRTALHLAASMNRLTTATYLLLEARADPNPLDRFLNTPLDDAVRHQHVAMEAFLRDRGGVSSREPGMASAVAKFVEEKKRQEGLKAREKLEKEVRGTEVSTIRESLRRFRDHVTLEDDVYSFATHATNFRSLLLRLLSASAQRQDHTAAGEAAQPKAKLPTGIELGELVEVQVTKEYRERLLERVASDMDGVATRLVTTMESEVLPWLTQLSRPEQRLVQIFVPGLKPAAVRIVEQLRGKARLSKFVRHLWQESGDDGGSFQCMPVGLLMQRVAEAPMDAVRRARLEAQALLWASGGIAGQAGAAGARGQGEADPLRGTAGLQSRALRMMLREEDEVAKASKVHGPDRSVRVLQHLTLL